MATDMAKFTADDAVINVAEYSATLKKEADDLRTKERYFLGLSAQAHEAAQRCAALAVTKERSAAELLTYVSSV